MRYLAFDVETPNAANRRMSAIGLTLVENGQITQEKEFLVNPQERFDPFNIELTGIDPGMVSQAPTFGELWPQIVPMFEGSVLVAHNAPFDMSVLSKCLRAYGHTLAPLVPYVCTCQIGRRCLPQLKNHKLNTMCDYFGIPLDHHHAGSDSTACAKLLLHYLDMGFDISRYWRSYDTKSICTLYK